MSIYKSANKAKKNKQASSEIEVPDSMVKEVSGRVESNHPQSKSILSQSPDAFVTAESPDSVQISEPKNDERNDNSRITDEVAAPSHSQAESQLEDDRDADEDAYGEGLMLLKCGYEVDLTRRDANKIMRIVSKAHDKVDTVSRKSIDLPNYIDTEVESLLTNFKRKTNVKISVKNYIISLICKDLIARGVFQDVKTGR